MFFAFVKSSTREGALLGWESNHVAGMELVYTLVSLIVVAASALT